MNLATLIEPIIAIARQAGEGILEIYSQTELFQVQMKPDNSPVTKADLVAHDIILKSLRLLTPEIPVLSEEGAAIPFTERRQWQYYWLVDPVDGTREFIRRSGEFTVNIALIYQHRPVLGVIYTPVSATCYYAWQDGGSFKREPGAGNKKLIGRLWRQDQTRILASYGAKEDRLQKYLGYLGISSLLKVGSSWKFGLLAEGRGDIYPRLGDTCEWDTAAGQCVLEEAGGAVVNLWGEPLRYNLEDSLLNPYFIAVADFVNLKQPLARIFNNYQEDGK